jgi:hypothetical protein
VEKEQKEEKKANGEFETLEKCTAVCDLKGYPHRNFKISYLHTFCVKGLWSPHIKLFVFSYGSQCCPWPCIGRLQL